jgi:hypothetical protein
MNVGLDLAALRYTVDDPPIRDDYSPPPFASS